MSGTPHLEHRVVLRGVERVRRHEPAPLRVQRVERQRVQHARLPQVVQRHMRALEAVAEQLRKREREGERESERE